MKIVHKGCVVLLAVGLLWRRILRSNAKCTYREQSCCALPTGDFPPTPFSWPQRKGAMKCFSPRRIEVRVRGGAHSGLRVEGSAKGTLRAAGPQSLAIVSFPNFFSSLTAASSPGKAQKTFEFKRRRLSTQTLNGRKQQSFPPQIVLNSEPAAKAVVWLIRLALACVLGAATLCALKTANRRRVLRRRVQISPQVSWLLFRRNPTWAHAPPKQGTARLRAARSSQGRSACPSVERPQRREHNSPPAFSAADFTASEDFHVGGQRKDASQTFRDVWRAVFNCWAEENASTWRGLSGDESVRGAGHRYSSGLGTNSLPFSTSASRNLLPECAVAFLRLCDGNAALRPKNVFSEIFPV